MLNKLIFLLLVFTQLSFAHGDHEHDPKKVLVISADHSSAKRVVLINKSNHDKNLEFTHAKLKSFENQSLVEISKPYDLVVFSTVSATFSQKNFASLLPFNKNFTKPVVTLPYDKTFKLNNVLTGKQAQAINDYYRNGGKENMSRLGDFLNTEIFKVSDIKVKPAIIYPSQGNGTKLSLLNTFFTSMRKLFHLTSWHGHQLTWFRPSFNTSGLIPA